MIYVICIGSNECREENMALARTRLVEYFPDIQFSSESSTDSLFFERQDLFSNQVARFSSDSDPKHVKEQLKSIEREAGRMPEDKKLEIVRLDIDLLLCDKTVFKPLDLQRAYVLRGIKEIIDNNI